MWDVTTSTYTDGYTNTTMMAITLTANSPMFQL